MFVAFFILVVFVFLLPIIPNIGIIVFFFVDDVLLLLLLMLLQKRKHIQGKSKCMGLETEIWQCQCNTCIC